MHTQGGWGQIGNERPLTRKFKEKADETTLKFIERNPTNYTTNLILNFMKTEKDLLTVHSPGSNYTGPGTPVITNLLDGIKPSSPSDLAAIRHDLAYLLAKNKEEEQAADNILAETGLFMGFSMRLKGYFTNPGTFTDYALARKLEHTTFADSIEDIIAYIDNLGSQDEYDPDDVRDLLLKQSGYSKADSADMFLRQIEASDESRTRMLGVDTELAAELQKDRAALTERPAVPSLEQGRKTVPSLLTPDQEEEAEPLIEDPKTTKVLRQTFDTLLRIRGLPGIKFFENASEEEQLKAISTALDIPFEKLSQIPKEDVEGLIRDKFDELGLMDDVDIFEAEQEARQGFTLPRRGAPKAPKTEADMTAEDVAVKASNSIAKALRSSGAKNRAVKPQFRPNFSNPLKEAANLSFLRTPEYEQYEDRQIALFSYIPEGSGVQSMDAEKGLNEIHNENMIEEMIRFNGQLYTKLPDYEPVGTNHQLPSERRVKRARHEVKPRSAIHDSRLLSAIQLPSSNFIVMDEISPLSSTVIDSPLNIGVYNDQTYLRDTQLGQLPQWSTQDQQNVQKRKRMNKSDFLRRAYKRKRY